MKSELTSLFDLTGKRAAIVGGTGVLGGRFAHTLAAAGARVIVLGRSRERGESVVQSIEQAGGTASFEVLDASNRDSVVRAREKIARGGGLDVLINAPGANSTTPFEDIKDEEWQRLLDVNLGSVFRVCQEFLPLLQARPEGASIINVSSASSGPPLSRVFGYGVAKAGVNNLTQYLARELAGHGIRVNAIVPGFFPAEQNRAILTPERLEAIISHTPMARLGEPQELDGVLLWLSSHRASGFVTGALVPVDGGFSAMTI
ncbi:SDR family oxidoreductase [Cryobacterium levicorallinum]|uniref:NAD(P)-dependent dehydrogenase, short-chain alcohol dehydrogenase family n=1 Tax=Cryobacterium levicorallinum TaxID=995038 RepID=A0A1I3CZ07_9MICO|nr:SDR family oxidoreductase [Cryobacterium levicorallinum]TFB78627.1 SDR family oxidoreductase [Cryobacterium levicorallinum]GEP27934.1 D-mannonate oxidoreductase [Cryobacterium levicorallinum]SFH79606.1 NAD(P)-dependent dehydrogenase, short-chain alcohol dehydrogenase family [Cryobacterium levicorallinum]